MDPARAVMPELWRARALPESGNPPLSDRITTNPAFVCRVKTTHAPTCSGRSESGVFSQRDDERRGVFQGVIGKHQWPFWSRVMFHAFGGRFGDHRDWPVIEAWADSIALALASLRSVSPS